MELILGTQSGLPENVYKHYTFLGVLPDERVCGIYRLMYHWTLHVDISVFSYEDRYCYETFELAFTAIKEWNGDGEPTNWHRHYKTGRRRNLVTGEEWIEW